MKRSFFWCVLFGMLFFNRAVGDESLLPSLPISSKNEKVEPSIAINSNGNILAVWEENGIIKASDLPPNGSWSMPITLSNVMAAASLLKLNIDSSDTVTVIWEEENGVKAVSRNLGGDWCACALPPTVLKTQEAIFSKTNPRFALRHTSDLCDTKSFSEAPKKNRLPYSKMKFTDRSDFKIPFSKPTIQAANAIDAPSSGVLRGAQIGFAAGTAAPSDGLLVSGIVGFGTTTTTNQSFALSGTTPYIQKIAGTQTTTASGFAAALYTNNLLEPAANTTQPICGILNAPQYILPMGVTASFALGLYCNAAFNNSGTITLGAQLYVEQAGAAAIANNYGIYVKKPVSGSSSNTAIWTENMSIGTTFVATTPPTDGLLISGNVGIGTATIETGENVTVAGVLGPAGNKAHNLGVTDHRFNTAFYVTATTGTSRLAPSNTYCETCNQRMFRGTGTTITLGEIADYIPVFCLHCGKTKTEALSHLPKSRLTERKEPSSFKFLGLKVCQYSGNSRGIQVMFDYGEFGLNSTFLSDFEYEQFKAMDAGQRKQFLKELGTREWYAIEELRLMKEECKNLQEELDDMVKDWTGTNL